MTFQTSGDFEDGAILTAQVLIIGGGACGLTLARQLSEHFDNILVCESGGAAQNAAHAALDAVDMEYGCWQDGEVALRAQYHAALTSHWDPAQQAYGLRCRGLGGATQAWAGKCAPFETLDYESRDWVPQSGWPFGAGTLDPYVARAKQVMGLSSAVYDHGLWARMGKRPPQPDPTGPDWRTVFWEFARSADRATELLRFADAFRRDPPSGVRVLLDATATELHTSDDGSTVAGATVRGLSGRSLRVSAPVCVLATGAIEVPRLLLASRGTHTMGLGNAADQVGRCLMDHPTTIIGQYGGDTASDMAARFGLYAHRASGRTAVYMHGLALSPETQRRHALLNGAVFSDAEHAPDDPFAALRRLARGRSANVLQDSLAVSRSPWRLAKGAVMRGMERGLVPEPLSRALADTALRLFPNAVAQDYRFGKLPHKFVALRFLATTEQPPDPSNRITLSSRCDPLGQPLPRVRWTAGQAARRNLLEMAQRLRRSFQDAGLAVPKLPDWVEADAPDAAPVMDLGHPMGTARMSPSPQTGVTDPDGQVYGVRGLFVAGGAVFPTSGHANPTLMMVALTLRLGDHLVRKHPGRSGPDVGSVTEKQPPAATDLPAVHTSNTTPG